MLNILYYIELYDSVIEVEGNHNKFNSETKSISSFFKKKYLKYKKKYLLLKKKLNL